MARYVARRVLDSVPVVLGLTVFSFVLIHLVPGDPVVIMLGGKASPETIRSLRHALGLDQSLPEQYWRFLSGLFTGSLGTSIILHRPVGGVVAARIEPSAFLITYATAIAVVVSIPLGILSALWRNRWPDHLIRVVTLVGFAMPPFWLGLVLIRTFSLRYPLFPVGGYGSGPVGHVESLTLPAVTTGLFLASMLIRSLRSNLVDVFGMEYIEAARARGLSEMRIVLKHSFRNALIGTITVLAVNIGWLIGGAVVIERVFDIPGLGQLLVQSILTRDFPVVQALTLVFGVIVVGVNLVADVAYAVVDPRVRYA